MLFWFLHHHGDVLGFINWIVITAYTKLRSFKCDSKFNPAWSVRDHKRFVLVSRGGIDTFFNVKVYTIKISKYCRRNSKIYFIHCVYCFRRISSCFIQVSTISCIHIMHSDYFLVHSFYTQKEIYVFTENIVWLRVILQIKKNTFITLIH